MRVRGRLRRSVRDAGTAAPRVCGHVGGRLLRRAVKVVTGCTVRPAGAATVFLLLAGVACSVAGWWLYACAETGFPPRPPATRGAVLILFRDPDQTRTVYFRLHADGRRFDIHVSGGRTDYLVVFPKDACPYGAHATAAISSLRLRDGHLLWPSSGGLLLAFPKPPPTNLITMWHLDGYLGDADRPCAAFGDNYGGDVEGSFPRPLIRRAGERETGILPRFNTTGSGRREAMYELEAATITGARVEVTDPAWGHSEEPGDWYFAPTVRVQAAVDHAAVAPVEQPVDRYPFPPLPDHLQLTTAQPPTTSTSTLGWTLGNMQEASWSLVDLQTQQRHSGEVFLAGVALGTGLPLFVNVVQALLAGRGSVVVRSRPGNRSSRP